LGFGDGLEGAAPGAAGRGAAAVGAAGGAGAAEGFAEATATEGLQHASAELADHAVIGGKDASVAIEQDSADGHGLEQRGQLDEGIDGGRQEASELGGSARLLGLVALLRVADHRTAQGSRLPLAGPARRWEQGAGALRRGASCAALVLSQRGILRGSRGRKP